MLIVVQKPSVYAITIHKVNLILLDIKLSIIIIGLVIKFIVCYRSLYRQYSGGEFRNLCRVRSRKPRFR